MEDVIGLAFSPARQWLFGWGTKGGLWAWDVISGGVVFSLNIQGYKLTDAAISPDGRCLIASAPSDGYTGIFAHTLPLQRENSTPGIGSRSVLELGLNRASNASRVTFSADGHWVAARA